MRLVLEEEIIEKCHWQGTQPLWLERLEGGTGAEVGTAGTLGGRSTAAGLAKGFRGVQAAVDKSNRY